MLAIDIDSQDNIYIGGNFTNLADDANADHWARKENGGSWEAVDDIALNSSVTAMVFNEQDELFVGGNFTNADSVANADYIFKWNGYAVEALDTGLDGVAVTIAIAPDGNVWATGGFGDAGGVTAVYMALWNGASWAPVDLNISPNLYIRAIDFGPADPIVPNNYDVYIGYDDTGTAYFAGDTTVTNGGTAAQYPIIHIKWTSGGTSARLVSVKNWTTGHELFCDYDLLEGEEIVIDCRPLHKSITSSFFGNQPKAILPNSDFGSFHLQPGANDITFFVDESSGAVNITAYMLWKDMYRGMD